MQNSCIIIYNIYISIVCTYLLWSSYRLKEAVDDYISELQNEKLSQETFPKQVNIDNVLPKIRHLFNDELSKKKRLQSILGNQPKINLKYLQEQLPV
ncbi:MAG: hypothetical protein O7C59_01825 [Rickettsia endosymbiont of Ixodes persulcatus]|nr:hypothetical protein [Rickettsia endosymbiont of Ixodes persulcatus]